MKTHQNQDEQVREIQRNHEDEPMRLKGDSFDLLPEAHWILAGIILAVFIATTAAIGWGFGGYSARSFDLTCRWLLDADIPDFGGCCCPRRQQPGESDLSRESNVLITDCWDQFFGGTIALG